MTKFKRTYKIRQHMPLIHFQGELEGASLRATEVKPKLDKFLIDLFYEKDYERYKKLLVAYKGQKQGDIKEAFDYKLRIKTSNVKNFEIPDRYPCFFANMGADNKPKTFSFTKDMIEFEVFSLKSELLTAIDDVMADFLLVHTFGSRQSKGFGCFELDKSDPKYMPPELDYSFEVDVSNARSLQGEWKEVFYQIDLFYKTLRSGINLKDRTGNTIYFKSLLFLYAKEKLNIQWEKKSIKEEYFAGDLNNQKRQHNGADILNYTSQEKKLMKAVFGLSSQEQWYSYKRAKISVTHADKKIDRFKSPLLFKPVKVDRGKYEVHFGTEGSYKGILDEAFKVEMNGRGRLQLNTPKAFNFDDFFDFIFDKNNVNIYNHVDDDFHNSSEFMILEDIYKQLQY